MPKILYFITKSNWGGAQRHVYDLATSPLILNQYDVKVYAGISGNNNLLFEKLETFNLSSLSGKTIKTGSIDTENNFNIIKSFFNIFEIYKILKIEKPNIVHLHSSKISLLVSLVARIYNIKILLLDFYKKEEIKQYIKIIYTAHGWIHNEPKPWPIKKTLQFMMFLTVLLSHQTICVSRHTKKTLTQNKFLQNILKNKLHVIYNGIDQNNKIKLPKISEAVSSPHYGKLNLVSLGELHHNKGHDTVIKYINELTNVHYHIIGEGVWRPHLEKLIQNTQHDTGVSGENVNYRVTLHGHIDQAADTLSQYDLFLMPSRKEGFSYTILEALNAGLPVIARDVGGVKELLKNDNSISNIILYQEDIELVEILKSFDIKNINKYNHWVDDTFSFDQMVKETMRFYY